jgi:signal transduction histidine kinase
MRTYVRRRRKAFRAPVDHTDRAMTTQSQTRGPSPAAIAAIGVAAAAVGALVIQVALASDHREARVVWAVFGPLVGWSFIAAGLYAWRIRPQYRTGELMIVLGFAWFLFTLDGADDPAAYTFARILGGLWGSVFLHLGLSFPAGRLTERADRVLVLAGYLIFPLAGIPQLLFAGPADLGCGDCPVNVLLVEQDAGLATAGLLFGTALYLGLFLAVLYRAVGRWRRSGPFVRLQLTPVYVCSLLTFLLVTVARAGGGDAVWWAAFIATALMPFAFLGGLLRSQVFQLDEELQARLDELRASRARLVAAGDAERRRLERDLHDGAQSRLVALSLLLRAARRRAGEDRELAGMLDEAQDELQTSLAELRELARGIHPAVLSRHGLAPALDGLAARAPVPVTLEAADAERLPPPIESAAYFVVAEALVNVAKYASASQASVRVAREGERLTVDVADDGIGGADAERGSGLRGLADRVAALDGTLTVESPVGGGTRLRAELPL